MHRIRDGLVDINTAIQEAILPVATALPNPQLSPSSPFGPSAHSPTPAVPVTANTQKPAQNQEH